MIAQSKKLVDSMAEAALNDAKEEMLKRGSVPSVVIGFDGDGRELSLRFGFNTPEERRRWLTTVKFLFAIRGICVYVMVHESWFKSYSKDDADAAIADHEWGKLGKEPDRKEAITVTAVCPIYVAGVGVEVLRENGKVVGFKDMPETTKHDGEFTHLIRRERSE